MAFRADNSWINNGQAATSSAEEDSNEDVAIDTSAIAVRPSNYDTAIATINDSRAYQALADRHEQAKWVNNEFAMVQANFVALMAEIKKLQNQRDNDQVVLKHGMDGVHKKLNDLEKDIQKNDKHAKEKHAELTNQVKILAAKFDTTSATLQQSLNNVWKTFNTNVSTQFPTNVQTVQPLRN